MKIIAMIMIAIGVVLLGFGTFMRAKQIEIEATKTEIIPGNKEKATAVGAVTGAVAGAGTAATVGGVGVVLCC